MQLPPALNQMPQDQMGQQMNPDMNNQQGEEEPVQILAHIAPDEIPYLNEMQGQEIIDPETGLRDYTLLGYMASNFPEVNNALLEASQIAHSKKMAEGGRVEEAGRPIAPELEELRQAGRGNDTELIIITPELADLFDTMHGGKSKTNPITGFPEYGFFKELFRIAAPIVGAVFGGPVGAFAASTAANKVTGKSWGDSLKQGALSAGITFAAPIAGGMFQGAFPGVSSALGGATRGALGNTLGGSLANLFTPGQGTGVLAALGGGAHGANVGTQTAGRVLPGAAYGAAGAGKVAAQGAGQGILSQLGGLGTVLPLGAAGLMALKGAKEEKKSVQDYDEKQRRDLENLRDRYGFNERWKDVKPLNRELNTTDANSFYKPYELGKIEYMKEGGAIKGHGKGQQDNISKRIPENSYIIDASSVSDIGDGSSDAGYKELDRFFAKLPNHEMNHKKGGYIKALVSDGEYEVSPEKVTALGQGSNKKGAMFLEEMINELRKSKRTSGHKLPPKAKSVGGYLKTLKMA